MNTLQRTVAICIFAFLFCTLCLSSSMAQNPDKSSKNIRTKIILRSMTAKQSQNFDNQLKKEKPKKNIGQRALSFAPSSFYSSIDPTLQNVKKHKKTLVKQADKLVNQVVKSPNVKWIVRKVDGSTLDEVATGSGLFGAAIEGDSVGVTEGLINSAGSGFSASAGMKAGALLGSAIAPGPGTLIGGFVGSLAGAVTYNVVLAPQVEKAGDYASDKISTGEAQIEKRKLEIKRAIKKNFDTVYPNGYTGSGFKDPLTGMIEDLRPDVLYQRAEKIREAERKKNIDKIAQEIKKNKKKMEWKFTSDQIKPEKTTPTFKAKKAVPNVKNKSIKDAFTILKNAGFILGAPGGGDPAPAKKLVGHVQATLPAGGQPHYQDSPVVLVLYSDVVIPDVEGMTAGNASKKLNKAGFLMKVEECDPCEPPPTKNLSLRAKKQVPAANASGKGYETVTVTFYPKYQKLVTPKLTGFELSKAQGILEELKLSSEFVWGEHATTKDQVGTIQKQQPVEGDPIEPDGEVKAWVYYTAVPKVLTMSKEDAVSAMRTAWFVPNTIEGEAVENKYKWGTIYSQTLKPMEKVAKVDIGVNLKFYKKPEKRSEQALVGYWEGYEKFKEKKKTVFHLDIISVNSDGKFKATAIFPAGDYKRLVYGTIKKNEMTFIRKDPIIAASIYHGIVDVQQMTIKGTAKKSGTGLAEGLLSVSRSGGDRRAGESAAAYEKRTAPKPRSKKVIRERPFYLKKKK